MSRQTRGGSARHEHEGRITPRKVAADANAWAERLRRDRARLAKDLPASVVIWKKELGGA